MGAVVKLIGATSLLSACLLAGVCVVGEWLWCRRRRERSRERSEPAGPLPSPDHDGGVWLKLECPSREAFDPYAAERVLESLERETT